LGIANIIGLLIWYHLYPATVYWLKVTLVLFGSPSTILLGLDSAYLLFKKFDFILFGFNSGLQRLDVG
jgi:hypothetical protein